MKIYTKTGDDGTTSLANGKRVSKTNPRLEAYGTADELNSHIGLLRSMIASPDEAQLQTLTSIQSDLFTIGALLAGAPADKLPDLTPHLALLEEQIDEISLVLPPLKSFILPAGCQAACQAHVCRTITRRLERMVLAVNMAEDCSSKENDDTKPEQTEHSIMQYINRLSDYFFVLARYLNQQNSEEKVKIKN